MCPQYNSKSSCQKEYGVYRYLKKSGHPPNYLPQYYGALCLTPDHVRTVENSIRDAHRCSKATIYRVGIGIERIEGPRLSDRINDMTDEQLILLKKKIMTALLNRHECADVCHRDIEADNVLIRS